jgi:hypothetical protein
VCVCVCVCILHCPGRRLYLTHIPDGTDTLAFVFRRILCGKQGPTVSRFSGTVMLILLPDKQKAYHKNSHTHPELNNFIITEMCGYGVINLSDIRLLTNCINCSRIITSIQTDRQTDRKKKCLQKLLYFIYTFNAWLRA